LVYFPVIMVKENCNILAAIDNQLSDRMLTEVRNNLMLIGHRLTIDETTLMLGGNNHALIGQLQERGDHSGIPLKVRIKLSFLPHKVTDMRREVFMLDVIKQAGLPTPKIFYFGQTSEGMPFMIQEFIDGIPVRNMSPKDRMSVLYDLQDFFVKLHSIIYPGFGRLHCFDGSWRGINRTWSEALENQAKISFRKMYDFGLLGNSELEEKILALLKTYNSWLNFEQGVLLHGDAGLMNFLGREGRLVGIVDPEFATVGDPAWEFAGRVYQGYRDYPADFMESYFEQMRERSNFPLDRQTFYKRGKIYSAFILTDIIPLLWESGNIEGSKRFISVLPREIDKAYSA